MTGMDLRGLYGSSGRCCGARRGERHHPGCPEADDGYEQEDAGLDQWRNEREGIVAYAARSGGRHDG